MNIRRLALLPLAVLAAQAHAQISGVAEYGSAFVYQADWAGGTLLNNYYAGVAYSASYPYAASSFGADSMATQLFASASQFNSPTYLQMDGSFRGYAAAYWGESQGVDTANAQAYDQVNFTLSSSALVTLTSYNASSSIGGFSNGFSEINFNGAFYLFTPSNYSTSFVVGPGSYFMWWDVSTSVYAGQSYGASSVNLTTSDFRFTVSTTAVPEPTSLGLLATGAIALIRRRRKPNVG